MLTSRLLLAAAIVGGTYLWVERQRPNVILMPDPPLASFPLELGSWTGKNVEIDDRTLEAIGAEEVVNRLYASSEGQYVNVNLTAFTDYATGLMHHPMSCYPAGGWKFQKEIPADVTLDDGRDFPVKLLRFERNGQLSTVLYWYQLGDLPVFSKQSLGAANLKLGGARTRPALVKVILQISASGSEESTQRHLTDFAAHVLPWTIAACKADGRSPNP